VTFLSWVTINRLTIAAGFYGAINLIGASMDEPSASDTRSYRFWYKMINGVAMNFKAFMQGAKREQTA
jgi:hypothetical protein